MIAHNKNFSKTDYITLENLSEEVCKIITSALNSINEIKIEDEERDEIAENITLFKGDITSKFIKSYNLLTIYIREICEHCSSESDSYNKSQANKTNLLMQIRYLHNEKDILKKEFLYELEELARFRNILIHQFGVNKISEEDIIEKVVKLDNFLRYFLEIHLDKNKLEALKGFNNKSL